MAMTTGTHARRVLTKKADAVLTLHNLLVKPGTDADHIAVVAAADEEPLGVCQDAPDAAEYSASVALFTGPDTVKMVAAAALVANSRVFAIAAGKVNTHANLGAAGQHYLVGKALTAATAADEEIEVEPCFPVRTNLT